MLTIEDHFVQGQVAGKPVQQEPIAGKDSGQFQEGKADTVVIHYTAGPTLYSALATFRNPNVQASAHIVIDRDGTIAQLIPLNQVAWHAGRSEWAGRSRLNRYSIGIELVNAGKLQKSGSHYISWFSKRYEQTDILEATHRNQSRSAYWHLYTPEQIEACFELCHQLKNTYGALDILGHEEVAPDRKEDPGPAFPLDTLRTQVLERRDDQEEDEVCSPEQQRRAVVSARRLNFRMYPYGGAEMAGPPLEMDTEVDIIEEKDQWRRVRIEKEGWVHARYLVEES